ncbi:HAD hydrolase-like protein [Myxosarcina sp. GI1]|uniref:HAD hydrolase-like protein n=1 Tax=Myxosarcina sp. GI1 TaxID=1541065 RepID=UPI00055E166F|nr:HAD family hydrolase [Myxosarcina sp. GI1]
MTGIVVFDIIGTSFSLEKPRQQLIALGAPPYALELWFAQSLRDAFAFSHAGEYQPLKEILQAELPRTLKLLDIEPNSAQLDRVMKTFSELDLQPGAKEAFAMLSDAGWKIVALTNGSQEATNKLLERAAVKNYFSEIYSCDAIAKTKPHRAVYEMIHTDNLEKVWLVAAHAWDIAGAKLAGMKTAFVRQLEKDYLAVYPQPEIAVENLPEAARQIINAAS